MCSRASLLNLSHVPVIHVLSTHLSADELNAVEEQLQQSGAPLTYDITEANLVVGKVGSKKRAELELRSRKLWTEEIQPISFQDSSSAEIREPPKKRARLEDQSSVPARNTHDDTTTEDEEDGQLSVRNRKLSNDVGRVNKEPESDYSVDSSLRPRSPLIPASCKTLAEFSTPSSQAPGEIRVLKLQWLLDSFSTGHLLSMDSYLVYHGKKIKPPPGTNTASLPSSTLPRAPSRSNSSQNVPQRPPNFYTPERGKTDHCSTGFTRSAHDGPTPHGVQRSSKQATSPRFQRGVRPQQQRAHLLQATTSEYDGSDSEIPPPPDWVKLNILYSCQRSTPAATPNGPFIEQLKSIKVARLLQGDEIGVRAYSTSIASLAAYQYPISNSREILRLPGCDVKIANLWVQWKNTGTVAAIEEGKKDGSLQILETFYNIWGVGAKTAREFYYEKGWTNLDDVLEFGWKDLSRVQKIGLKYYEEFMLGIPREEVEFIAEKVKESAIEARDEGIEIMVVGGYRRGKEESGDVDIIVSHRDLDQTENLVADIEALLVKNGWITHTLLMSLNMSHRGQKTLPLQNAGDSSHSTGFDTLDKALVVWQDPIWPTMEQEIAQSPNTKNPNVHRRVDIIVAPWRTVGCAILGWSGGTTFQRDLRRYAKKEKGWKFDSSGIRSRATGDIVPLEGEEGVSGNMIDAERAVFEGLGLVYREAWERCTG